MFLTGISFLVYAHFVKITTRAYNYGLVYSVGLHSICTYPKCILNAWANVEHAFFAPKQGGKCVQANSFQGTAQQQVGTKNVISAGWGSGIF